LASSRSIGNVCAVMFDLSTATLGTMRVPVNRPHADGANLRLLGF